MKPPHSLQAVLHKWHHSSSHPQVNSVIHQLKTCRTEGQGYHLYKCSREGCGKYHYRYHSCRNRHCPQCGSFQKEQWIEERSRELLPTHYFHVVFTLPHQLNGLILGNRKQLFKLLFAASAGTLLRFAKDKKYLGATPGILSVLHTWGQQLSFHPHVHCIVSGGGWDNTSTTPKWKGAVRNSHRFLFPVKAVSQVFRAKFLEGLKQLAATKAIAIEATAFTSLINTVWKQDWVVYAKKPFGGPGAVINYLGRYTHKTAISNQRITQVNEREQTVSFSYRDYKDGARQKIMTLQAGEFIRRFEQHILPKGFTRIRSYGYLANRGRTQRLQLITQSLQVPPHPPKVQLPWQLRLLLQYGVQHQKCPHCGELSLQMVSVCFSRKGFDDS